MWEYLRDTFGNGFFRSGKSYVAWFIKLGADLDRAAADVLALGAAVGGGGDPADAVARAVAGASVGRT